MRARRKFTELDHDKDGVLLDEELLVLVDWLWDSFYPGGYPLPEEQRAALQKDLLRRVDKDHDGAMDFDEFSAWLVDSVKQSAIVLQQGSDEERQAATARIAAELTALACCAQGLALHRPIPCQRPPSRE